MSIDGYNRSVAKWTPLDSEAIRNGGQSATIFQIRPPSESLM